jgi:NADH-quinone oxidoreductase subunit H
MKLLHAIVSLLVFPGLLYAIPMGWLMMGVQRRLRARCESRIGPPLSQPFFDFVKLMGKRPLPRSPQEARMLTWLPLIALASIAGALALLPVFLHAPRPAGDMVLLVGLLEMPPLLMVLAGYASRSIYGEVGATREAIVGIAANVPFLAALVAMATAADSLRLSDVIASTPWAVRAPALLTMLFCLPAKLRMNPFSLANAEQELLAGPLTEYDGRRLAIWELVHGVEYVALAGLFATMLVPVRSGLWIVDALGLAVVSLALVPVMTTIAASTARLKLTQATRWLWRWASLTAAISLAAALYLHGGH